MNPFKPGDIVFLNSGSPPLTVIEMNKDLVHVAWIDDKSRPQGEWLPYICLRPAASK